MESNKVLAEVAGQHREAVAVIARFLEELNPGWGTYIHIKNAGAILARLASHEPPILMHYANEEE